MTISLIISATTLASEPLNTPLTDPAFVSNASVADLLAAVPEVVKSGSASDKSRICEVLEQVFVVKPDRTSGLTFAELQSLQRLYRYLRVCENDRGAIVSVWLENVNASTNLTLEQRVWVLGQFESTQVTPSTAMLDDIKNSVLVELTQERLGQMTPRQIAASVRSLEPHLTVNEKHSLVQLIGQAWIERIESKTEFTLRNPAEFTALRAWQEAFALLADGASGSFEYMNKLPTYLDRMSTTELYWRFRLEYIEFIARPINTREARSVLLTQIYREDGSLRQATNQVLSYSYRVSGEADVWGRYLDTRIKDLALTEDQRAQWMIAKAFHMSLTGDTHKPSLLLGQPLLHQAIQLAKSDDTRMVCLEQLILNSMAYHRFDQAKDDLQRYSPLLTPASMEALSGLQDKVEIEQRIVNTEAGLDISH